MKLIRPSYFDTFRCIADRCPDSCCKEWGVLVDPEKAAFYRSLPGELGDRLRQVLKEEDGETFMTIENRRCPMWRDDGLCRIQAELGEAALCKTCREFPRLTHDYGTFIEYGLELSCPEAARLILDAPQSNFVTLEVSGGEDPDYETADMEILLRTRDFACRILQDTSRTVGRSLAVFLLYACRAQEELNGLAFHGGFDADAALSHAEKYARCGSIDNMLSFFKELEILTPQWAARLSSPRDSSWESRFRSLACYFVDRYWLQAISDYDLVCRAKFAVISCLMIKALGGDLLQTAQLYSKEIENSTENVDALLDAAYEEPCFADAALLDLLLR